jgi:hypothetical protein
MKLKVALSILGLALVSTAGLARASFAADASTSPAGIPWIYHTPNIELSLNDKGVQTGTSSAIMTKVMSWCGDATPQIVENLQNAKTEAFTSQEQQQLANIYYTATVNGAVASAKNDNADKENSSGVAFELPCVLKIRGKAEVLGISLTAQPINVCETSMILATAALACKAKRNIKACVEWAWRTVKAHLEKEVKEVVVEPPRRPAGQVRATEWIGRALHADPKAESRPAFERDLTEIGRTDGRR